MDLLAALNDQRGHVQDIVEGLAAGKRARNWGRAWARRPSRHTAAASGTPGRYAR